MALGRKLSAMRPLAFATFLACLILVITTACMLYNRHDSKASTSIELSSPVDSTKPNADIYGGVISARLGNATVKAELGRSTWKLLHTMAAQYPEEPTADERAALHQFIMLLSRLYPCGECAEHFQSLLKQYPPQTSSRIAASQWACAIHNKVNERLGKEIFDCANIQEKYQCGCELD